MSSMEFNAPAAVKLWSLPSVMFGRALAMTATVIDAFNEAQRQAEDARRRYPFVVW